MKIAGLEKLSVQDYPNHISCIVFTQGCNMKCPYCQNSILIDTDINGYISEDEVLDYLTLRKNVLNGVTISGGEPTIQSDLKNFIKKIKKIGFDVKLDTNGLNYNVLEELIEEKMVDYVAMDIKNVIDKYDLTTGIKGINIKNIQKSIELLKQKKVDYEFRTTIIAEHHTLQDIYEIVKIIGNSKYYLQNFKRSENVLDENLTGFSDEKLNLWNEIFKERKNVFIRGIDKN
ncbi:MAG: anaerobic ribonucleoside-triphosphate reductase activating protein [Clostridia bacterium]|nr:anaerobic ribonucleoside-triphosphate reductase activating protein [Clostridia bacterium]